MTGGESDANAQVPPSPEPAPPPAGAAAEASATPSARPSRRVFLLGGGIAVLAGAGAGVGVEFWQDRPESPPRKYAPAALRAALAAERDLIATLDASLPAAGTDVSSLHQARADHVSHERALAAAVTEAGGAPPKARSSASAGAKPPPATALSVAQLRQAETDASRRAAERANALSGRDATLLASIAACEASHAELLA